MSQEQILIRISGKDQVGLTASIMAILSGGFTYFGEHLQKKYGIAFHAKPRVKEEARQSLSTIGLDGVLYFLGFKDSHLGEQGRL